MKSMYEVARCKNVDNLINSGKKLQNRFFRPASHKWMHYCYLNSKQKRIPEPYLASDPHQVPRRIYLIYPHIFHCSLLPTHATRHLSTFEHLNQKKIYISIQHTNTETYFQDISNKARQQLSHNRLTWVILLYELQWILIT